MNAILVRCQWRMGDAFRDEWFMACPREGEYVLINGDRHRVCQVQHHKHGTQFVPHAILQREVP